MDCFRAAGNFPLVSSHIAVLGVQTEWKQALREKHTMHCYGLETANDFEQCWKDQCQDPVKQAFSTPAILRSAGVEYDFEETGRREHLIARISDLSRQELPPCKVYGTQQEYKDFADASNLAQGAGSRWAIHLAQLC